MNLLRTHHDVKSALQAEPIKGSAVGFVPTMGALHEGHISLVREAKKRSDAVVVSIFVNPTQFNNADDLSKYPRTLEDDLKLLGDAGADMVYTPTFEDIYPDSYRFKVSENEISNVLCGAHRPGHFDGVLTVMMRLLNIVSPQFCFMGEKDYQQLLLVRQMADAFFMKTQIIGCPTVREADGLAMSSRNRRLSADAREKAPLIFKLLKSEKTPAAVTEGLKKAGFNVDYVEEMWGRRFAAASLEDVRLIDNVAL